LEKPLKGDVYKCSSIILNDGDLMSVLGLQGVFRISGDDNFIIEGKVE
jgi:hypothetical protein